MKTIVISSQKGGSGKTTLAAHLAVAAGLAGSGAAWLIDTDKQGTLTRWHDRREAEEPGRLELTLAQIPAGLAKLEALGADFCLIDSAPTISADNRALIELADLVLIPVKPSPADLWAVGATVELARNAGREILFVLSQAKPRAGITAQAAAALAQFGPVAQSLIADRVAYAAAMINGRTVQELESRSKAAAEIAALWLEIDQIMKGNRNG